MITMILMLGGLLLGGCTHPDARGLKIAPTPTFGPLLFQDDFSQNTTSGWHVGGDPQSGDTLGVEQGHYHVHVHSPGWLLDSTAKTPPLGPRVRVEVDATKQQGAPTDTYGLVCRLQDDDHFYIFLIGSNGSYRIVRYAPNGKDKSIATGQPGSTRAIYGDKTTNRLRADCIGSTLTLYVNGTKLLQVNDATYTDGQAGLAAYTSRNRETDVVFDNFVVMKP